VVRRDAGFGRSRRSSAWQCRASGDHPDRQRVLQSPPTRGAAAQARIPRRPVVCR